LYIYFQTRTVVDKELVTGLTFFVNIWYFLAYMFLPLAQRIVDLVPSSMVALLQIMRYLLVVAVPIVVIAVMVKGNRVLRLFLVWSIMFIATTAIFQWNVGLFDLYPVRTASRYMYSANLGMAVLVAWGLHWLVNWQPLRWLTHRRWLMILTVLFVAGNLIIVKFVSQRYMQRQTQVVKLAGSINSLQPYLADHETLHLLVRDLRVLPPVVVSDWHLEAMIYVICDQHTDVIIEERPLFLKSDLKINSDTLVIGFDDDAGVFIEPVP